MQWIEKKREPAQLREWRLKNAGDINFGYNLMRQDRTVSDALLAQLLAEQGRLCAYTGRRIGEKSCHMEHVKPQDFCRPEEAVSYLNIVACYPEPNRGQKCPYGADEKGNFPAPGEEELFVSPLAPSCAVRFHYTYTGHVRPVNEDDVAAAQTIAELNLDHRELQGLRRAEIQGTLSPNGKPLTLEKARHLFASLTRSAPTDFRPFHFVLKQALASNIRNLEAATAAGEAKRRRP